MKTVVALIGAVLAYGGGYYLNGGTLGIIPAAIVGAGGALIAGLVYRFAVGRQE